MRTLIRGGWVVAFSGGGHELIRDGAVVYEGDRIVHVGHRFDGRADRTIDAPGMLVSPGLINTHVHAATNARSALFLDATRADYFGMNFVSYQAGLRGAKQPPRSVEVDARFGYWAAVRGGATTILDVGIRGYPLDEYAALVGALGVRAYAGPGFRDAGYVFDAEGRVEWEWTPGAGLAGLERAKAWIAANHGSHHDRLRGMLYPGQVDTTTPETLAATKVAARELGVGIQLHAALNQREFQSVLRERNETPLQYLRTIGFLGPEVILGHCVFHAGHSWAHYPYADDLALVAASGASVSHSPSKYAKMGLALESFSAYRARGINLALGTDTYPQDLIAEMRLAGLMTRWVDGSFRTGAPRDVYDAATLGGARALGRDDLGRLAPGAKADLILVDLAQAHHGAVRDPIASLVECGSGTDVRTVIVDGETLLDDGKAVRFDEAALLRAVQTAGERIWRTVPEWRPKGQTVDDVAPMSYRVREPQ